MTSRAKIALASLGSTIAMTPSAAGALPSVGATDPIAGVPDLAEIADLEVATLFSKPGAETPAFRRARRPGLGERRSW